MSPEERAAADRRLAVYGTLAPGRKNDWVLSPLPGTWTSGTVRGRRVAAGWGNAEGFPALQLDPAGAEVALTTGEFDLLITLLTHAGRVLSRDFLLEHTRGRDSGPFDRTIDVQIGRLRRKVEADPDNPQIIKSVRGAGYILVPRVEAA